jgi:hypothetical protein
MPISKRTQTIISLIATISWFIARGFLIGTYLPIGLSILILGFAFVVLTLNRYKRMKNE